MQEQGGAQPPELPEPKALIQDLVRELGLDAKKKPVLFQGPPEEQLFPEEAPTFDGRYVAGDLLEQIYNIVVRHTPPGAPILLSKGDVRWLHREFHQIVEQAWEESPDLAEPCPDFTLTHLLGAAKREIAHLSELKRYHETDTFDPA